VKAEISVDSLSAFSVNFRVSGLNDHHSLTSDEISLESSPITEFIPTKFSTKKVCLKNAIKKFISY
jgi:hypothetical protein